jgi:hypothetical protein
MPELMTTEGMVRVPPGSRFDVPPDISGVRA